MERQSQTWRSSPVLRSQVSSPRSGSTDSAGHVHRTPDGRIPKDLLYGELASDKRAQGCPHLRFKDVCKRIMKSLDMDTGRWETLACDRDKWRQKLRAGLLRGEAQLRQAAEDKHSRQNNSQRLSTQEETIHKCIQCNRDLHSHVGLFSHSRHFSRT